MPRHLTVNDETVVCGPYLGEAGRRLLHHGS